MIAVIVGGVIALGVGVAFLGFCVLWYTALGCIALVKLLLTKGK